MSQATVSASIPASRGRVWQVVSDLQNPQLFHPLVEEADILGDRSRGVGAERLCYMTDGTEQLERVTEWVEGAGFSAEILESNMPFRDARFTIRIAPNGNDRSTVELDLRYNLRGGLVGRLSNLAWRGKITEGLSRILRGLSLHASTDVHVGPDGGAVDVTEPRKFRRIEPSFQATIDPSAS